jgi:P-type Cu2+ transporter
MPANNAKNCECYHCGQPVPEGTDWIVDIADEPRAMCCLGCQAVARAIVDAGHAHYYQVRTEQALSSQELIPEIVRQTEVYDNPAIQRQFVRYSGENISETSLILEGITCAACVWLNEQHIAKLPGVLSVQVNYATRRAQISWDSSRIQLSEILQAVQSIGYHAVPYNAEQQQAALVREQRTQLRRIAFSGLLGMQVMMISISLYVGAWSGMEQQYENFFRWLSLALTLPVVLYSSSPFFYGAWRDIRHTQLGMDVPVSLGIGIAFLSSVYATSSGVGETYFDTVVMFVFLLLLSRYFESASRRRSLTSIEQLAQAVPLVATRLSEDGLSQQQIAVVELQSGDLLLVKPGEVIPADGVLCSGESTVDESLLTGESIPVVKKIGQSVVCGSINIDSPIQVRVESVGTETVLSSIQRMVDKAQSDKPKVARMADRVASYFVVSILLIASAVAVFWWLNDSGRWLEISLTVLIVTCPCALSLAVPTAMSTAIARLQNAGLLLTTGNVIQQLTRVSHIVFDKTGTLTSGQPTLVKTHCNEGFDESTCLSLAAGLERHSEHPLAKALVKAALLLPEKQAVKIFQKSGRGISGEIDSQQYILGSVSYVAQQTKVEFDVELIESLQVEGATLLVLATENKFCCLFVMQDVLRSDAMQTVNELNRRVKSVMMMTGDQPAAAAYFAQQVGIDNYQAGMLPEQKMQKVAALQQSGAVVMMVGDGVNDAPVLSLADCSIAMRDATVLAKQSADIVLYSQNLGRVVLAIEVAHKTRKIIRQNLFWALAYNVSVLPVAAAGLIAPWMAAIGMSLSSLIVVLNALRLTK